ncbi:carbohydrate-binding module family 13 protein [Trichoderma pleuroticola]
MAAIDTSKIYILKNSYTAGNKILAMTSSGDSLSMVDANSVSSNALWFLTPTTMSNYYRLHTVANGVKQSLDVINDGVQNVNLHMADTGNFTGQDKHLDVYSDTLTAHLAGGNHTGQHWELTPARTAVVVTDAPTASHLKSPRKISKGDSKCVQSQS